MSRQIKKVIQLSNDELTEVDSVMRSRVQTHTAVRNATILYMAHQGNTLNTDCIHSKYLEAVSS